MTTTLKEKIIAMANEYISVRKSSFKMVADKFGVCESTAWKYLNVNLEDIDPKLFKKVQVKKQKNINRSQSNIIKFNIKASFERAHSKLISVLKCQK